MDASQLLKSYQELFYKCYIENNILESEITTDQDIELLEDLQPDEVFDNFKDLVHNLLEFKRRIITSQDGALVTALKYHQQKAKDLEDQLDSCLQENENLKIMNEESKAKICGLDQEIQLKDLKILEKDRVMKEMENEREKESREAASRVTARMADKKNSIELGHNREGYSNTVDDIIVKHVSLPGSPHKRINSVCIPNKGKPVEQKKQTIKSVKFEYFPVKSKNGDKSNNKVAELAAMDMLTLAKNGHIHHKHSKSNVDLMQKDR